MATRMTRIPQGHSVIKSTEAETARAVFYGFCNGIGGGKES